MTQKALNMIPVAPSFPLLMGSLSSIKNSGNTIRPITTERKNSTHPGTVKKRNLLTKSITEKIADVRTMVIKGIPMKPGQTIFELDSRHVAKNSPLPSADPF